MHRIYTNRYEDTEVIKSYELMLWRYGHQDVIKLSLLEKIKLLFKGKLK